LPLAASLGAAFVIPDEQVLNELAVESEPDHDGIAPKLKGFVEHAAQDSLDALDQAFGEALSWARDEAEEAEQYLEHEALRGWFDEELLNSDDFDEDDNPPHHGTPPPHHKKPHKKPPHHKLPHHAHKFNLTIYELISKSNYTKKLSELVSEDSELVDILNSTSANITGFIPLDGAFKKIPPEGMDILKKHIKPIVLYHLLPEVYPAGRVLASHTLPTMLNVSSLGDKPQRIVKSLGLKGLTLNHYAKVIGVNFFGTNGVIHPLNKLLFPPFPLLPTINLVPTAFSTLSLGLERTGLDTTLNSSAHAGGTYFLPPNAAFKKLGPKINAFLFSPFGMKYLKALLEYHVVFNETLYSDAFYSSSSLGRDYPLLEDGRRTHGGYFHVDLPTLLHGKPLPVDVTRWGPFVKIKVNGFTKVSVMDAVLADGVAQIVPSVLIPPKPGAAAAAAERIKGEMSVE
ncbi:FAS1 domain-containing protein, partial [Lineolata rhizophorae]